jgi:hypothetical protein
MDRPINLDEFMGMGPEALQSGLFPNGYRPDADLPAFMEIDDSPVPATRRTRNPPSLSSARDINVVLQTNEQAVPRRSRRSGNTHVNAPFGENARTIPTNPLTAGSIHRSSNSARNNPDQKRKRPSGESGRRLSEDTNHDNGYAHNATNEAAGSEYADEDRPSKRRVRKDNDKPQQSISQTPPRQSLIVRLSYSQAAVGRAAAKVVAANGTATRRTTAPGKPARRKATPRKATPRKVTPRKAATPKPKRAKAKKSNGKYGSGEHLYSDRFATREYNESKSLAPHNPPLKTSKRAEESRTASGSPPKDSSDPVEIRDLLHIMNFLSPHTGQGYFQTMNDIEAIDKMIIIGLKVSSKGEDENGDDHAEASGTRPKARKASTKMFAYTGLNTNLPPLSNIDEIFADLTQRALGQGLDKFLKGIGSRAIKVATLCSGTESPLLALQMVQESEYMSSSF